MGIFSDRAQGVVTSLDSGLGLVLLRGLLYGCLALAILGGYAAVQFRGLRTAESMEFAHVARNVASGNGFSTRCVRPFDVWYLQRGKTVEPGDREAPPALPARIPELRQAPAYPVLLSILYRIVRPGYAVSQGGWVFDAEYKAVVPLGILLTLLCACAVFGLGNRLFGPRVAGLATVVYLVSNVTLSGAISGLPLPLLGLVVTLACGLAVRAIQLSATGEHVPKLLLTVVGSAVCAAVAMLTDYTMVAVVIGIVFLFALQLQRLRWVSMLLFLLIGVAVVGPWLMHNHSRGVGLLGARPYGAVADSSLYADDALERTVAPEFNSYRVARAIQQKVITSVASTLRGPEAMAGGIIICFFVLALVHRYENPAIAGLKGFVLGVLGLLLLLSPLVGPGYIVLGGLFPLVVLLGVSAFVDYVDREEYFEHGLPTALAWLLIAVSALPAIAQVMSSNPSGYPPYHAPMQRFVCGLTADEERLYTDIPWATAWYGDRTSVLLPREIADVDDIAGGWEGVGGLYLTTETSDRPMQQESTWRSVFGHEVPESVPLRHAIELPAGRPDQLFLTDRVRW
jgi:hypothetical protein